MNTTKEVSTRSATTAVAKTEETESWGTEKASSEYIKIPYLLLMQKPSALVEKGSARIGDLVNSTTEAVLAPFGKSVEIIPFFQFDKYWTVRKVEGNKFIRKLPLTVQNKSLPYLDTLEGQQVKNVLCSDFAVLLTSEVKGGAGFPYIVSFQSTSFGTGRQLETDILILADEKKPIAYHVYELSSDKAQNDKGQSYQVFKLKKLRKTTPEELAAAKRWWSTVSVSKVKSDDDALETVETEHQAGKVRETDKF